MKVHPKLAGPRRPYDFHTFFAESKVGATESEKASYNLGGFLQPLIANVSSIFS